MGTDVRQSMDSAARLTLVVLGLIVGDLAYGLGTGVAVGMGVTAVVGVALNVLWRGRSSV
jgi:hypothetical protein